MVFSMAEYVKFDVNVAFIEILRNNELLFLL